MPVERTAPPVLRLVENGTVATEGLPAPSTRLRLGKVRTAQARISAGYYDREDVRERVLIAVLAELNRR